MVGAGTAVTKEVQEDEEVQGGVEVWWGEEQEGKRAGVQMGSDTVRGLQEEDEGVAVSFRMTDTGRSKEEAPIVPVGHKWGESARRIRLTVHGFPADRVWYLVLVQAYLEQGRAKGDRAWCHGVVVTKGWKARTDNKWAVYRALRAHLDQVPLNYPSETVVQPSSTAHFHYGFPTVEPLSRYSNKLLSSNLKTAIFQPCKRCHTP